MSLKTFAVAAALAGLQLVSAATSTATNLELPSATPVLGTDTVHGCFSSVGSLVFNQTDSFNSQGACAGFCRDMGKYVGASQAKDCYCGDTYPPENTLVDDSKCSEPCPGYDTQACGGLNTWTVYNTGVLVEVAYDANVTSTTTSTSAGSTATDSSSAVTSAADSASTSTSSSSGGSKSSNTVGIAVGSVVGVVAVGAIAGIAFFVMRRRRNREIEEEHRRNAAVNAFIAGGKPPSSSGGYSMSDQRLDPVMVQRRMSSGSIADEQDYSRRILRVTNA
ncbi:hypothetical protein BX600DRAFT_510710 [Xylariales sp. PMI_506]|nr:hypothetical protein BX600DRAFT_510710 [Xylariales sp. PMI_506]